MCLFGDSNQYITSHKLDSIFLVFEFFLMSTKNRQFLQFLCIFMLFFNIKTFLNEYTTY